MSTANLPPAMFGGGDAEKLGESKERTRATGEDAGGAVQPPTDWLGIETDHRRLLEAGQDGWLHPRSGGFVLGRGCFVGEPDRTATRNAIPVRLVLDSKKLPLFRVGRQDAQLIAEDADSREKTVEEWLAPIPLYAVTKMEVSSGEERTRLLALGDEFSNVSLPEVEIEVGNAKSLAASVGSVGEASVELPESLDAIQGAMAMASWAVPRVDPWIEALQWVLNQDAERAARKVAGLSAAWLRFPWCDDQAPSAGDGEARLWRAAVSSMRGPTAAGQSPAQLAETIAGTACNEGASETAERWLRRTRRIVAAEETFGPGGKDAGLAIQLVLLRPEPMDFRAWRELPWLPPGVWWAAALLCGWRHGYRALDKRFRGDAALREFLATRALLASWPDGGSVLLPTAQQASLERRGEGGCYTLHWGQRPVLRKRWHARAKWYTADLRDEAAGKAAQQLASELGWGCFRRRVRLKDGHFPVSGKGGLSVDDHGNLVVRGTVDLELPAEARLVEELDEQEFRRALASEAGTVPDPPTRRFEREEAIPGLVYRPDFIAREEERNLVARIDEREWSRPFKRRVQQYGWRYDYRQREIDASMHIGELPDWAAALAQRLVDEGLMDALPDQLIVNEYIGSQGISPHIDQPHNFAEQVAMISLLETWGMVFRPRNSKRKVGRSLERRSVAVLAGDARYRWTHEIPARKYEYMGEERRRVRRKRRVSLTFRKVQATDGGLFALAGDAAI